MIIKKKSTALCQRLLPITFLVGTLFISPASLSNTPPNTMTYPEKLQQQITLALKNKGVSYQARTRHLADGKPVYTNRLILTESPYLIQHAHNPVNWYPWGEEAFAIAKKENKPIFLSIGYATCHWCHVMEEESFESLAVAKILNQDFIAIKVDREQHPDVDATYMTAVTMLAGRGGWPMSSFITTEGKPFYGGTYYPEHAFISVLTQLKNAWDKDHKNVLAEAERISQAVTRQTTQKKAVAALEQSVVQSAAQQSLSLYDPQYGGFSQAPKFPNEPILLLLLQLAERNSNPQIIGALNKTLNAMAEGGIYDQVGGGFHRYATDSHWLTPHFEKMLYNQAYLARAYLRAYRLTGNPLYARIATQTLDYTLREMKNSHHVFYSATDADSEGEEGTYFVWTIDDIKKLLPESEVDFFISLFGLTAQGNFEGKNILFLPQSLQKTAQQQNTSLTILLNRLDPLLELLRKHRQTRIPPLTDDKVITAWNGMLIATLAEASDILKQPQYLIAAKNAAQSLWQTQYNKKGKLWRINLNNQPSITAKQDDYAHFSEALLALYDATADKSYLEKAELLAHKMVELFLDTQSGAFVMGKDQLLFTHPKDSYDGALPSGNAMAVQLFNRLFKRTGKDAYQNYATNILNAFSSQMNEYPSAYTYMLAQLDESTHGEVSHQQYAARGAIKIDTTIDKTKQNEYKLTIHFKAHSDWHINSNKPLQKDLIATELSIDDKQDWLLKDIQYPQAELIKTKFGAKEMALYQGAFTVSATLSKKGTSDHFTPIKIKLNLQACNQESCLAPELLTFFMSQI